MRFGSVVFAALLTATAVHGDSTLELRISAPELRRNPVRAIITSESGESRELQISARELRRAIELRVARGTYTVTLEAPHHIRFRTRVVVANDREKVVAALKLMPALTGTVVARTGGRPVGGALIRSDAESVAIADATGRFALEADPEQWPKAITVSAAGYAETTVIPPRARASTSLDEIRVSRAGSVAVGVADNVAITQVELRKSRYDRVAGTPFRVLREPPFRFDEIEPGEYIVLASGSEPCQRFGELIELREGETKSVRLEVVPFQLLLRGERAGEPLAAANILLSNHTGGWEGRIRTNEDGESLQELWQGGELHATVFAESSTPWPTSRTIDNGEDAEWLLDIPTSEVTGVVVDAASGAAIPDAALSLRINESDSGFSVRTRSDENGRFRFSPVPHGTHILKAGARDFLLGELTFSFPASEQSRSVTMKLDPAARVRLTVTDARGIPIGGARVLHYFGPTTSGIGTTDAAGTIDIPIPKGQIRDVYVVPRDGSFGFIQLQAGTRDASLRIPDATSRIVIRTESEAREPIPNLSAVIRYNLRVLPAQVMQALEAVQGAQVRSGSDGRIVLDHMPAGAYEFSIEENAPARLTVTAGEHNVVLTFARAEKP